MNSSLEQVAVPRGTVSEKWKRDESEETMYFTGFLIDLLDEIVKRYKKELKKDFPKYRIITSKAFAGGTEEGVKGGGFGSKELPKAAAKEGDGEGDASNKEFKGLVQEVRCGKKMVALMPMTPTPERKTIVSFTEPFFDVVSLSILMKKPILQ